MNYKIKVQEVLTFLETQVNLPREEYIDNLLGFAKHQIASCLEEEQYFIINRFQSELFLNTPPNLIELAQIYSKNLALVNLTFKYDDDFDKVKNEDIIKIKINYYGSKKTPRSEGLLRISAKELEKHIEYLYSNDSLLKSELPSLFKFTPASFSDTLFASQRLNKRYFPILKSIMDHQVPASIVYFEFQDALN